LPLGSGSKNAKRALVREDGDYYTMAPGIQNRATFEAVLNSEHGFLIADNITKKALRFWGYTDIDSDPRLKIVLFSGTTFQDSIWLYRF
jgi:hypothetical protein